MKETALTLARMRSAEPGPSIWRNDFFRPGRGTGITARPTEEAERNGDTIIP
jgi:hypothetical protein